MSEATKKTTATTGSKRAGATAKAVDKSAAKQTAQTESDAVAENKPTESMPKTPVTGEADKPEQSTATKADSETKGENDEAKRSEGLSTTDLDDAHLNGGVNGSSGASVASDGGDLSDVVGSNDSDIAGTSELSLVGVMEAFEVTAKSDAGFWRAGTQFHRIEKTLILVTEDDVKEVEGVDQLGYKSDRVVCLSPKDAKRVHSEQHLVITDLDLDELLQSTSQV